ncbi:MAG: putative S-methyl-5'-thioinosine phosphorylase [Gammaproteobacteria bacterium]|nr:MAG: putative S-methyl-5'-thioinosine phosphorylase [Gammaproteobacteria bacterium]
MSDIPLPLGIIGGTALHALPGLEGLQERRLDTPYGAPSSALYGGRLHGRPVWFLGRHGERHDIAPHRINYRANVWALREAGARALIGVASCGGIGPQMAPGVLAAPAQLIDYTWGRAATFFDEDFAFDKHIDFTEPYDAALRGALAAAARRAGVRWAAGGTLAVTQGPRLETAAEIRKLAQDGCDLVNMTGMPEAALAREAGLPYACLAVVVNWAAGVGEAPITLDEIRAAAGAGQAAVAAVLEALLAAA